MKYWAVILTLGVCCHSSVTNYRLSKDAMPSHYSLKIRPDIDDEDFEGEVSIYIRTTSVLDKIILHAAELNITNAYINYLECSVTYEEKDKISLRYDNELIQPGEHILHMTYTGILKRKGTGFLKAAYKYFDEDGFIMVTDFEPIAARSAFPCFDEPSFKASYSIRIVAPDDTYTAISNMPEINNFKTQDGFVHVFASSIKMSTYLVSFAVMKYPFFESYFQDGDRKIPIRIFTYNASAENNEYAMNCTKTALEFYTKYTGINYPLSKLDMIEYVRPETAATENWGLITLRQGLLSLNLGIYDKSQIKQVIFHEISHFWFGNIVTNDWWNDIWLHEGFATYMSFKLYTAGLELRQDKVTFFFDGFFESDNIIPTRPVVEYLPTQAHVPKRFDTAVYQKGAAILFMLEDMIGNEAFQLATRNYLEKYAYKTATTNDFITTVEEVVPNKGVRGFMETYIYQNRFPIIKVDGGNGTFILTQQVCNTIAKFPQTWQKWTIPIKYVTDKIKEPSFTLFDKDMDSLIITVPDANWILLNSKGTGIYKVLFSENQWEMITDKFQDLSPQESYTLVSDAVYAYKFNIIGCELLLQLMSKVQNRKQWSPLSEFHWILEENLRCNNYSEELSIYYKFLNSRFVETGYPNRLTPKCCTCSSKDSLLAADDQTNKEALQKCAKWIRDNLQEKNNSLSETQ